MVTVYFTVTHADAEGATRPESLRQMNHNNWLTLESG